MSYLVIYFAKKVKIYFGSHSSNAILSKKLRVNYIAGMNWHIHIQKQTHESE